MKTSAHSSRPKPRKHWFLMILVLGLFIIVLIWVDSTFLNSHVRDISKLLEKERKQQDLPAVAAVVVVHDKIVAQGVAGVRKLGGSEKALLNDRWHLGSCTKSITATIIAVLVERGDLDWNTTVSEVLSDLDDVLHPAYRNVTIEMLLAHRGGIHHEFDVPGLWDRLWKREGTPVEERRKMTEAMLSRKPKVKPGQYFYSNCGYGIAGHMVEVITGIPWEELIQKHIFQPLNMKSAGFGVPWEGEPPTDPWPHQQNGSPVTPGRFADNPPSIEPGGTIHASIGDWAKFIIEHLQGSRGKNGRLLEQETFQRLHKKQKFVGSGEGYSLGWKVLYRPWAKGNERGDNGRCLNHEGSNNSWYAIVWIAPERNFAVLVTTNIGGDRIFPKVDAVVGAVIHDYKVNCAPSTNSGLANVIIRTGSFSIF